MKTNKHHNFLIILFLIPLTPLAQVTLDGTLGAPLTLPGPDFQIGAELGQQQGDNLFHSFQDFNLNQQESATFSGPDHIQNVISRVTGGYPSHIDGVIRSTFPQADIYFLNPAGLFFGEHAELDVNGSFHASTAHYLRLGEQGRFDARQPNNSVLTVAPVSAFGFMDETIAPINLSGQGKLQVPTGQTLSFIGGDLTLTSGNLKAEQGRINLASVASAGEVQTTATDLDVSSFDNLGNISLTEKAMLDVSGAGSGHIFIRGNQFFASNSDIMAKTEGAQKGGDVDITSQTITLNQGSRINVDTVAEGQGGNIVLTATGDVNLISDGKEPLTEISAGTTSKQEGAGQGGTVIINAKNIILKDGAIIDIAARGQGHAGQIQLIAQENISLAGTGGSAENSAKIKAYARMDSNGGNAGDVLFKAENITLADGAYINASTFGPGKAGNITLQANGIITLTGAKQEGWGTWVGSGSHARVEGVKTGEGGQITITAKELTVSDGANIASSSVAAKGMASSQAGNIEIHVTGTVKLSGINPFGETEDGLGSGIYVRSRGVGNNAGNGGTLHLRAGALILEKGAIISSSTSGEAQGGNVNLKVQGTVQIMGDSANVPLRAPGEVQLDYQAGFEDYTPKDSISGIYASSTSVDSRSGEAGQISLTADSLQVTEKGTINTATQNAGGGGILLQVGNLLYLRQGEVTTSVHGGSGDGGNITIDDPVFIVLDKGSIKAQADAGRGGDIQMTSQQFIASPDSIVSASSRLGIDGEIILNSPSENVSSSLIVIPSYFIATDKLQPMCGKQQETESETSHFVVKHYNNHIPSTNDLQPSPAINW